MLVLAVVPNSYVAVALRNYDSDEAPISVLTLLSFNEVSVRDSPCSSILPPLATTAHKRKTSRKNDTCSMSGAKKPVGTARKATHPTAKRYTANRLCTLAELLI